MYYEPKNPSPPDMMEVAVDGSFSLAFVPAIMLAAYPLPACRGERRVGRKGSE